MGDPIELLLKDAEKALAELVRNDRIDNPTELMQKLLRMIITLGEAIKDGRT